MPNDVLGTSQNLTVVRAKGVEFPEPSHVDDGKALFYSHATGGYFLQHVSGVMSPLTAVKMIGDVVGNSDNNKVVGIHARAVPPPGAADHNKFLKYDHIAGQFVFDSATGGGGGEANTASNIGTAGVGLFKQKVGVDLQFKKINSGSSHVTVTDDTANDEVDINVTATATPTADRIPIADATAKLDGWVTYRPGGTDVAITDGGTGASTAAAAFDNLAPTTTKGDIIVRTSTSNTRLPVGADGQILSADSTEATGLKWISGGGPGATQKEYFFFRQVGTTPIERWYYAGGSQSGSGTATNTVSAGALLALPFVTTRSLVADRIACRVTTASSGSNLRMGIYRATSDTNLYPNELLLDTGNISSATTGVKVATISQTLSENILYWFVLLTSAGITMQAMPSGTLWAILGLDSGLNTVPGIGFETTITFGPLPATYPAGASVRLNSPSIPIIAIRISS